MNLAFFLDDTAISGTARATLTLADALSARADRVRIVTPGLPVTWRRSRAEWIYVDDLAQYDATGDEYVIAPRGSSVDAARAVAGERAVDVFIPAVDDDVFRTQTPAEREPLRVLIAGPWHDAKKGLEDAYGAIAHARWFHQQLELVRVSPFAPSREEPLDAVQEYHVALTADEMTRVLHSCDIAVAASHRDETFDLTTAEAMAAGLACVVTAVPAYLAWNPEPDFALFAREDDAAGLGERLVELLEDGALRARLRDRARDVSRQWRADASAERLAAFLRKRDGLHLA